MTKPVNSENWKTRVAVALKAGTMLSVLSVIAVVALHGPGATQEGEATMAAPIAMAAPTTAAPATTAAPPETTPYYFPSQFKLNATEPGESVPTF